MRKILYCITAFVCIWLVAGCDNEPKNPGDFSVKATLDVNQFVSLTTGEVYTLQTAREFDTVFKNGVQVWDTVWDSNGEFVSRTADTVWLANKYVTRFHEMKPVILPASADTFSMQLTTNAKWLSPNPEIVVMPWIYNEATAAGGGDGTIIFRVARNRNYQRTEYTPMYIYTSDSTVFYKIPFGQYGEKDE